MKSIFQFASIAAILCGVPGAARAQVPDAQPGATPSLVAPASIRPARLVLAGAAPAVLYEPGSYEPYPPATAQSEAERARERGLRSAAMPRQSVLFMVNWDLSMPIGNFNTYINQLSPRGVGFDWAHAVFDNVTFGIGGGWNTYHETTPRETFQVSDVAINTAVRNTTKALSVRFTARYYPRTFGVATPFVGAGVGPTSVELESTAADLVVRKHSWWFNVSPEIGVLLGPRTSRGSAGFMASIRYTWMPVTFENQVSNMQTLGAQFGAYGLL